MKPELDPVTSVLRFDPEMFGMNLSGEEFQTELADEFDRYNDDLLREVDPPSPSSQEFARLSVLDLLLSPASAIQFCDNFRKKINCPLVDPLILRILWQNREAIDAAQNAHS